MAQQCALDADEMHNQQGPSNTCPVNHQAQRAEPLAHTSGNHPSVVQQVKAMQLTVNQTCIQNHLNMFNRLYEQGASKEELAAYVQRWWRYFSRPWLAPFGPGCGCSKLFQTILWAKSGVVLDGKMNDIGVGLRDKT